MYLTSARIHQIASGGDDEAWGEQVVMPIVLGVVCSKFGWLRDDERDDAIGTACLRLCEIRSRVRPGNSFGFLTTAATRAIGGALKREFAGRRFVKAYGDQVAVGHRRA